MNHDLKYLRFFRFIFLFYLFQISFLGCKQRKQNDSSHQPAKSSSTNGSSLIARSNSSTINSSKSSLSLAAVASGSSENVSDESACYADVTFLFEMVMQCADKQYGSKGVCLPPSEKGFLTLNGTGYAAREDSVKEILVGASACGRTNLNKCISESIEHIPVFCKISLNSMPPPTHKTPKVIPLPPSILSNEPNSKCAVSTASLLPVYLNCAIQQYGAGAKCLQQNKKGYFNVRSEIDLKNIVKNMVNETIKCGDEAINSCFTESTNSIYTVCASGDKKQGQQQ